MEVRMSDLNSERINQEDQCNEEIKEFGQFTLSENREQRRIHLLVCFTVQESTIAACDELFVAVVLLCELIAQEEALGSFAAADLACMQLVSPCLETCLVILSAQALGVQAGSRQAGAG